MHHIRIRAIVKHVVRRL